MLQMFYTTKSYMSEFDLEVKGQGQTVKITFKAPSKGYVYLFFQEKSSSS
jgi:hypothetical protein